MQVCESSNFSSRGFMEEDDRALFLGTSFDDDDILLLDETFFNKLESIETPGSSCYVSEPGARK